MSTPPFAMKFLIERLVRDNPERHRGARRRLDRRHARDQRRIRQSRPGKHVWLEFCERWTKGEANGEEDWTGLAEFARFDHGKAGIDTLLQLAWRAGTPEAITAVAAVKLAQAQWAFRNPPDLPDNDDPGPALACDPWSRLREALHWSGADRARNSGSGIAWREPGIAVFGSESRGKACHGIGRGSPTGTSAATSPRPTACLRPASLKRDLR